MTLQTPPRQSKPARRKMPFGYVVIGIIILGIAGLIAATASGGRYELEVGEVTQRSERFDDTEVRVRGQIKEGSILATLEDGQPITRFTIVDESGSEVDVVSYESQPDNFEAGKSCIVEGRYNHSEAMITSSRITMKCPSKYEAEEPVQATSKETLRERYGRPNAAMEGTARPGI